jgi:hypothetical protein
MMNYIPLNSEILAKKRINKRMAKKFALDFKNAENVDTDIDKIYENMLGKINDIFSGMLGLEISLKSAAVKDNNQAGLGTSFSSQSVTGVVSGISNLVTGVRDLNSYIDINMPNLNMFSSGQRQSITTLVDDILRKEKEVDARMEILARRTQAGEPHASARAYRVFDPMFDEWRGLLKELTIRLRKASGVLGAVGAGYATPRRFL